MSKELQEKMQEALINDGKENYDYLHNEHAKRLSKVCAQVAEAHYNGWVSVNKVKQLIPYSTYPTLVGSNYKLMWYAVDDNGGDIWTDANDNISIFEPDYILPHPLPHPQHITH